MIFVDSNVVFDLLTEDPDWAQWSRDQLATYRATGPLLVSSIAYAEIAYGFTDQATLDRVIDGLGLHHASPPASALFRAARAFRLYRERGGSKAAILPDFLIGAHASVLDLPLLTRDARRYRTYFPEIRLILP